MQEKDIFLKDKVINKIFSDEQFREYLIKIIHLTTGLDKNLMEENLKIMDLRINETLEIKDAVVDHLFELEHNYVNIEVNFANSIALDVKNLGYLCRLFLKNHKSGEKYPTRYKIWQININNFDVFKEGKFIYKTGLVEKQIGKERSNWMEIIDIKIKLNCKFPIYIKNNL